LKKSSPPEVNDYDEFESPYQHNSRRESESEEDIMRALKNGYGEIFGF